MLCPWITRTRLLPEGSQASMSRASETGTAHRVRCRSPSEGRRRATARRPLPTRASGSPRAPTPAPPARRPGKLGQTHPADGVARHGAERVAQRADARCASSAAPSATGRATGVARMAPALSPLAKRGAARATARAEAWAAQTLARHGTDRQSGRPGLTCQGAPNGATPMGLPAAALLILLHAWGCPQAGPRLARTGAEPTGRHRRPTTGPGSARLARGVLGSPSHRSLGPAPSNCGAQLPPGRQCQGSDPCGFALIGLTPGRSV